MASIGRPARAGRRSPTQSTSTSTATPRRVEHQQTDKGYVPVYTTAVVEQDWEQYSDDDHRTWATLFQRQVQVLQGRACREHLEALDGLPPVKVHCSVLAEEAIKQAILHRG